MLINWRVLYRDGLATLVGSLVGEPEQVADAMEVEEPADAQPTKQEEDEHLGPEELPVNISETLTR